MDYTNGVSTMAESSFHESLPYDFGGKPSRAPSSQVGRAFKTSMLRKAQQAKSLKMAPGLGLHKFYPLVI